jgi:hypothetical protein
MPNTDPSSARKRAFARHDRLEVVLQRSARSEHLVILRLHRRRHLGLEQVVHGSADHLCHRAPAGPFGELAVGVHVAAVGALGARQHAGQTLTEFGESGEAE